MNVPDKEDTKPMELSHADQTKPMPCDAAEQPDQQEHVDNDTDKHKRPKLCAVAEQQERESVGEDKGKDGGEGEGSLRGALSEIVAGAVASEASADADSFSMKPFLDAQKHERFPAFAALWKEQHGREPFSTSDSCLQDLDGFQKWLTKDKQEQVTYTSILQEAVKSKVWNDYVAFWTSEDNKDALETTYYENFTVDSPDIDAEMEVSQWIRFVQKFSKQDLLASGGPTLGFINNIKDAMPRHLRDLPDALEKYRSEFPEFDTCFTLLKEVASDAKLFEKWLSGQDRSPLVNSQPFFSSRVQIQ
eukprot:s434_g20.t1